MFGNILTCTFEFYKITNESKASISEKGVKRVTKETAEKRKRKRTSTAVETNAVQNNSENLGFPKIGCDKEQGQIHGYPSRMRVGNASDKEGHLRIWARAMS